MVTQFPTKRVPPAELCGCGLPVHKVVGAVFDGPDEIVVRCSACGLPVKDCTVNTCH